MREASTGGQLAGDRVPGQTGSVSGIGRAVAEAFAREGADVAVTYFKDKAGAEEVKGKIEAAQRRAIVVQLDQRDPEQVERLFRETESTLGTPYILVNNAGIDSTGKEVADMRVEDWDNALKTNVYGPFYCCRLFIRARRAVRSAYRTAVTT